MDLEKEQAELKAALEEAFEDPMIKLGTAVYEAREALPEPLRQDLEDALGVEPPAPQKIEDPKPAPKLEPRLGYGS